VSAFLVAPVAPVVGEGLRGE